LSELEAQQVADVPAPPTPPKKIKVLNLSVKLDESADVANILAIASDLGEVRSVSINEQFDYNGLDYPY
jgi:Tfp pilus assembly protein FimV